jgi:hypothetical protein
MSELWLPGAAGPLDRFVDGVHRQIAAYVERVGAPEAWVDVELADGARFRLDSIDAQPGFGFVTLRPLPAEDVPDELIVPVAAIRRLELRRAEEEQGRVGFQLPG